mgnify:CR=1 FL=1
MQAIRNGGAALNGSLDQVAYQIDPWFGFEVPLACPGVPDQILLKPGALNNDEAALMARSRRLSIDILRHAVATLQGRPQTMAESIGKVHRRQRTDSTGALMASSPSSMTTSCTSLTCR